MNTLQAMSLARAMELDDAYPDNVCPGCQQNISGWERYGAHRMPESPSTIDRVMGWRRHYAASARIALTPWPFQEYAAGPCKLCPWNHDYLNARAFRRRFIADYQARAS